MNENTKPSLEPTQAPAIQEHEALAGRPSIHLLTFQQIRQYGIDIDYR